MPRQRSHFQEELEELERTTLGTFDVVVGMLDRTAEALEQQDLELGEQIVADDDLVDERYCVVRQGVLSLLARQAPMAGDLRLVAALLDVIKHLERVGDQCVNISKLLPVAGSERAAHPEILDILVEMAQRARSQMSQAGRAFGGRNIDLAEDLVRQDAVLNQLNRECFRMAMAIGEDPERREWAMHMTMVARALERIGDNAVDVGEQTAFLTTGLFREFTDASHPKVTRVAPV